MSVGDEVRKTLDHFGALEWRPAMWHATEALELTARKRYPSLDQAGAFKQTIRDDLDIFGAMAAPGVDFVNSRFPVPVPTDRPDGRPDIADVLYGVYRYLHVDESEMPAGCQVIPLEDDVPLIEIATGRLWLRARAAIALLAVAVFAPENGGQSISKNYFLSWRNRNYVIADWWGGRANFRDIVAAARLQKSPMEFGNAWDVWGPAPSTGAV